MRKWPTNRKSPLVRPLGAAAYILAGHGCCPQAYLAVLATSAAEMSRSQRRQRESLQKGLLAALGVLCGIGLSAGVAYALSAWDRSQGAEGGLARPTSREGSGFSSA